LVTGNRDNFSAKKGTSRYNNSLKEAILDINELESKITESNRYLDIISAHQSLIALEYAHELKMSDLLKVLLTFNGSVTQALQSIQPTTSDKIKVRTINQAIMGFSDELISDEIYQRLGIPRNAIFIFRKVVLHVNDKNLVLAFSFTPLCGLSKEFQDDLMEAKEPIGFLLEKHNIEVVRKILTIDVMAANSILQEIFDVPASKAIPFRIYDITSKNKIFMKNL